MFNNDRKRGEMFGRPVADTLIRKYITEGNHRESDYFSAISYLLDMKRQASPADAGTWQRKIDSIYQLLLDEIESSSDLPLNPVKFGTSGWRGILGKDLFVKSVAQVTLAIVSIYEELDADKTLAGVLGVSSLAEACSRGCVLGHDNRFGGDILARAVADVLTGNGFRVYFAGEATTGELSAAVLGLNAAFSVNLTPSHNPLQYGGFKFNAADAGPAAPEITNRITQQARRIMAENRTLPLRGDDSRLAAIDAFEFWRELVDRGQEKHGIDYARLLAQLSRAEDLVVAIDCVHGASRVHIGDLLRTAPAASLLLLRTEADHTFGGIAPEPSSTNMSMVMEVLKSRPEPFKLGAIIDPDADRIRFTDGRVEISMNQFGAMAYHFLHNVKGRRGMVAKSVATSNFANAIAAALGEEVFEPRVGFKEFKPVIDRALVCFEESDGISIIGHTPEKDAYIGLLLALDMILSLRKNLGDYLVELEAAYGGFFPGRDSIGVCQKGAELLATLRHLERYRAGSRVSVGQGSKLITEVLDIDGHKMLFEDGSWLMIRPSGTEPKVRFYIEGRSAVDRDDLLAAAKAILRDLGLA